MTSRTVRMERLLDASPARVYRAWSDPDALTSWFPSEVEGSLAPGGRTSLVWPEQTIWWEVTQAEPDRHFRFRWPWLAGDSLRTEVTVSLSPRGFGSRLLLTDGPFDMDQPGQLDAWAECVEGWSEALANLRATLDFSVDLRHVRGRMGAGPR
ncbi:MAG: SRPBCC domain-containing protein [Chloroflexi bacterium]|nr:SRPBCC domain-containing protein [Chloroflexota bacterium]